MSERGRREKEEIERGRQRGEKKEEKKRITKREGGRERHDMRVMNKHTSAFLHLALTQRRTKLLRTCKG